LLDCDIQQKDSKLLADTQQEGSESLDRDIQQKGSGMLDLISSKKAQISLIRHPAERQFYHGMLSSTKIFHFVNYVVVPYVPTPLGSLTKSGPIKSNYSHPALICQWLHDMPPAEGPAPKPMH
jgi:hypothetical protein